MKVFLLIFFIILPIFNAYKNEQIKTSISNPLFLVRPPSSEGVAVANEFIIQIYLRERLTNNFNIPYHKAYFADDIISKISITSSLDDPERQKILEKLQENRKVSRDNSAIFSYRLRKHIIMDIPISGLYWGQKYFIIQTLQNIHIYTNELTFIMSYQIDDHLLTMTTINSNLYLLFQDPDNSSKLDQVTLTFEKNSISKETSFSIELPQSYKIYQYFMNDYEWLYLINETHVSVYDILAKKIKNTIQSKFDHPITHFRVDQSDSLAIASNKFGDYLFISFNHVLLTIKSTKYTYATFCSSQYLVIGNSNSFQVMQVNDRYLSSEEEFEADDILAIECVFNEDMNIIYSIDQQGYLGIYTDKKTKWGILVVIVIIICVVLFLGKLIGDERVKELQRVQWQKQFSPNR